MTALPARVAPPPCTALATPPTRLPPPTTITSNNKTGSNDYPGTLHAAVVLPRTAMCVGAAAVCQGALKEARVMLQRKVRCAMQCDVLQPFVRHKAP
jgi:hypothetical protein